MSGGMGTGAGGIMPGGMMPGTMSPDSLSQEVFAAQQQVADALARYQRTTDETEREAIKVYLTKALERQFDVQQQRRMKELAEIEGRVQKLRDVITKRNQAKQSIVSKRCDQLLSELDGMGWIAPEEFGSTYGPYGPYGSGYPGASMMPGTGMPLGGSSGSAGMGMGLSMPGASMGLPPTGPAGLVPPAPATGGGSSGNPDEAQSMNNLRKIALAMQIFHDTYRRFPAAYRVGEDGQPLLSWRVVLLPFMGEESLFREFHLEEPWDSDHNRKLIERMPAVYRSPGSKADPGKTNYLTVRGPNTAFPGKESVSLADIVDGTSNTVMVLEVSDEKAVEWTRPDDLPFNEADPLAGVVGLRTDAFLAALCDGAAMRIRASADPKTARALFLCNDGLPLSTH